MLTLAYHCVKYIRRTMVAPASIYSLSPENAQLSELYMIADFSHGKATLRSPVMTSVNGGACMRARLV